MWLEVAGSSTEGQTPLDEHQRFKDFGRLASAVVKWRYGERP
jgi:hypothetical protein